MIFPVPPPSRASIGFLNKEAREIGEEFARNVTGKTATTPRWKKCVGSAAGSFSAAIGKMYVLKHFNIDAKKSMLEMVQDIRQEFKKILDEVSGEENGASEHVYDGLRLDCKGGCRKKGERQSHQRVYTATERRT